MRKPDRGVHLVGHLVHFSPKISKDARTIEVEGAVEAREGDEGKEGEEESKGVEESFLSPPGNLALHLANTR